MKTSISFFAAILFVFFAVTNSLLASDASSVDPVETNWNVDGSNEVGLSLKLSYRAPNGRRIVLDVDLPGQVYGDITGFLEDGQQIEVSAVGNFAKPGGSSQSASKRSTQTSITIKNLPSAVDGAKITIGRSRSGFVQGGRSLYTIAGQYKVSRGRILIPVTIR